MWYEIARQMPTLADQYLRTVGLARASQAQHTAQTLGVFAVGMLIGAGIGLLFAPSSGQELRERVRNELARVSEEDEPVASH
jgi:hypothetical protein